MKKAKHTVVTAEKHLQWHQAFYAGIQIELENEADCLTFENEHHLGTQPKRIDVLVIKKENSRPILKNIGKIFRKHNIIEYKSPKDYLSINDYYLVYGYACLYKSDEPHQDSISIEDITITLVSHRYPQKLIEHLKKVHQYEVQSVESGIYYIKGDILPIQLLVTRELTNEQNLWLHNLTNDIQDSTVVDNLISEYEKHQKSSLYSSVMDIIVHANLDAFKEVGLMCEALNELALEIFGDKIRKELRAEILKEQKEALFKEFYAEKDKAVAEKDAVITEKDAYIKQLELQLGITSA